MKNKKKIIIAIIVIASIILITYLFMPVKLKGYLIYGVGKCECPLRNIACQSLGGRVLKCKLCGGRYIDIWETELYICSECGYETGRCVW